jgi:hypothetical protein
MNARIQRDWRHDEIEVKRRETDSDERSGGISDRRW